MSLDSYEELNDSLTDVLESDIDDIIDDYGLAALYKYPVLVYYCDDIIFNIDKMVPMVNTIYNEYDKRLGDLKASIEGLYEDAFGQEDEEDGGFIWEQGLEDIEEEYSDIVDALGRDWEWKDEYEFSRRIREWEGKLEKAADEISDLLNQMKKEIFNNKENIIKVAFGEEIEWNET